MTAHNRGPRIRFGGLVGAAVAAALLGLAWDRIWIATDTLSYPGAGRFGQPWWVALEYGLPLGLAPAVLARFGDPAPRAGSPLRALGEAAYVAALYGLTGVAGINAAAVSLVLVALLVLRSGELQRSGAANPGPVLLFVLGAPALASALSFSGLQSYARPDLFGLPVWSLLLHMNAVPFLVRFSEAALWLGGVRRSAPAPAAHSAGPNAAPEIAAPSPETASPGTPFPPGAGPRNEGGPEARPPSDRSS